MSVLLSIPQLMRLLSERKDQPIVMAVVDESRRTLLSLTAESPDDLLALIEMHRKPSPARSETTS